MFHCTGVRGQLASLITCLALTIRCGMQGGRGPRSTVPWIWPEGGSSRAAQHRRHRLMEPSPWNRKKNIFWELQNSFLSQSTHYVTNKNKILNYNAVQSGKLVLTFPSCMPSSHSGPNETACSSATKLHGVTTSESILTAVKKLKSQTIKFLTPFLSLRSGAEKSNWRTAQHFARYLTHIKLASRIDVEMIKQPVVCHCIYDILYGWKYRGKLETFHS